MIFQDMLKVIIPHQSICLMKKNWNNGINRRMLHGNESSTLYPKSMIRCEKFPLIPDSSRNDSCDVWISICVREPSRWNSISIQNFWFLNCLVQKIYSRFQLFLQLNIKVEFYFLNLFDIAFFTNFLKFIFRVLFDMIIRVEYLKFHCFASKVTRTWYGQSVRTNSGSISLAVLMIAPLKYGKWTLAGVFEQ